MNTSVQQARMLLGVWGHCPQRIAKLKKELAWIERTWTDRDIDAETGRLLRSRTEAEIAEALRLCKAMDELVRRLPPLEREVVHLHCREGMRYIPMSFRLNYSVDYLRHVKQRANRMIADMLRENGISEEAGLLTGQASGMYNICKVCDGG